MDDANTKQQATSVFKKSSPNGKITVYLGKRDFVDHVTHVDPIDGVVLIEVNNVASTLYNTSLSHTQHFITAGNW
jgi:beta-arrestin